MNMDSDDEREEPSFSWQGSSGSIILINCFEPASLGTTKVAYEATCELVRRIMRQSSSNLIGVCLYGTQDSTTTGLAVPNMVQILSLASPTLDDFKKLLSEKIEKYGQTNDFKLTDVLWHCSKMFKQCSKRLSEKSVLMLTRLDVPPTNLDAAKIHQTCKRVMDLIHLGIDLKIINISEDKYDIHPFYQELLEAANRNNSIINIPEPVWNIEDICKLMQQHTHRHLALARLTFDIGDDLCIGVGVYKLVMPCPKPKSMRISSSTNEILATSNKVMRTAVDEPLPETSGESSQNGMPKEVPLLKSETLYYQIYGNEKIEFTQNELEKVKNPFPPRMLKLLGFKPLHTLSKEKWFLSPCAFLFPNESIVEGSTVAFKALHEACMETSMLPICVLCSRANSKPKIVALSPCMKPVGLNIDIGFDVIYIPFLENVKNIIGVIDDEPVTIDDGHKKFMKDMVKSLKFDFKSDTFENPVLQSMYRAIEALALEEEELQSYCDTTQKEPTHFQHIDAQAFEELFGPFGAIAPKRPATSKGDGPASKKAQEPVEMDDEVFESRLHSSSLHKYTKKELNDIIKWKNIPAKGAISTFNKDKLVGIISSHFNVN